MSAESQASEEYLEPVDFEDLQGRRVEDYHILVDTTARYVRSGLFELEECEPTSVVGKGETPSEAFIERFQNDVTEAFDGLTPARKARETARESAQATTDATKIDWVQLWENVGIAAAKPLSWTQAALAVDVSEQTPITDQGAKDLLQDAVDAGLLREFERKQTVVPTEGER